MDKFWGTALWKQSVWRGNGGMEPNLTTCSIMQGQRDASPSSEQTRNNSIHTLPASPGPPMYLNSVPSGVPCTLKYLFDSQTVFWNAPPVQPS